MMDLNDLSQMAYQHVRLHPTVLTSKLNYHGQQLWIKRRPYSKKKIWHQLQFGLSHILNAPIFSPTVCLGGPQSLADESNRLKDWAAQLIPVPKVILLTSEWLITTDVGPQLSTHISTMTNTDIKVQRLYQAIDGLNQVHQAERCHGRPSLKDMTIQHHQLFFIDLEEAPLAHMNLAQAQARDIWLFFHSLANHNVSSSLLINLFHRYNYKINEQTIDALHRLVMKLKPISKIISLLPHRLKKGRDIRCAQIANDALLRALT